MLSWLKWGKPVHPLADPDEAKQQLATLARRDPVKALEEVATWLDSVTQTQELKLPQRLEIVGALDMAAVAHRRRLSYDYVASKRLKKGEEELAWNASFRYWSMLAGAYLRCIEQYRSGANGSPAMKPQLGLVTARHIRALKMQVKWTLLRHGQVEAHVWRELGNAGLFAEREGVATQTSEIYPGRDGRSSPQEELLRTLMLAVSAPDTLVPAKLHIAERLAVHFSSSFTLAQEPDPHHGFVFDMAIGKSPARVRNDVNATSTTRFFGAGAAERGVRDLADKIRQMDGVPSDVDLGGNCDQHTVLPVLEHLARLWDSTPPERRAERGAGGSRIIVVPGLPNILRCLELVANGIPLDPASFTEQERWTTADCSEVGYGALVPRVRESFDYDPLTGTRAGTGDWLRIGCLLALSEENAPAWGLGIIRRITDEGPDQRRIGIELLGRMATVVKLAPAGGPRAQEAERRRSAVLLSSPTGDAGNVLVLMRAGHYSARQRLEMQLDQIRSVLEPAELIEAGDDFDCARYRVVPV